MAFKLLEQKILDWKKDPTIPISINGVKNNQWTFFLSFLKANNSLFNNFQHLLICPTAELAEASFNRLKSFDTEREVYFFPGIDHSPYGAILSSERALLERFKILDIATSQNKNLTLVLNIQSLLIKLPPKEFFTKNYFEIAEEDIISPLELAAKLVLFGHTNSTTVEEPGSFSHKGEIFDIFPLSGPPVRLHYFDDLIEKMFLIDIDTNKTVKDITFSKVRISATPRIFTRPEYTNNLREKLPIPTAGFKNKFELRKSIFANLSNQQMFENYPTYCPLFFNQTASLFDYFDRSKSIISFIDYDQCEQNAIETLESLRADYAATLNDLKNENLLPPPNSLFYQSIEDINTFPSIKIQEISLALESENDLQLKTNLSLESIKVFLSRHINLAHDKLTIVNDIFTFLKKFTEKKGLVYFVTTSENSKKEIKFLIENKNFSPTSLANIKFLPFELDEGFYYSQENIIVLCDGDLFSTKSQKIKKHYNKSIDLFAEQLSTIKVGDFVMHSEHGLGVYKGLEPLTVGDNNTDFLIIQYANKDKIYLPVYKLNQIQKYADSSAELKPANLRSNKFNLAKTRAKDSAKKLAFDLIKLQAERQTSDAFQFSPPDHYYREFELAFPFKETPDQIYAIENVLKTMQKSIPMDHLVCGDVGFGKTEIAMRAAFKAVEDKKQVAILVPTTILALQHFHSFKERFKDFPVTIDFLSRFKSPKDAKEVFKNLTNGSIDIVIGTHKLLSNMVVFNDLGLVIVDEEQRFGVGHKEKLKLLKSSVDFLTLTATPIPRTMQLAFLGLRDLSLIQTAPPNRQSIKTYILKEDDFTIKNAIEKELARGGQVFIVHNKVSDIEVFSTKIQELVPHAKIVIGHGQLTERELEQRMNDFYSHKYQILIATTIIESGLDIPNANTLIIDRADKFGLSQLHQLRGRIGRSDKKAYAYFMIPADRNLTPIAQKRLKALQTYADMGSGFSIASSDLEIRGAGDILGASQSGHIEEIGLELYMELLKEAVAELKGVVKTSNINFEINTPYSSFIPKQYILNSQERLKYYKKLSNCSEQAEFENLKDELQDIFGVYPPEVNNLFLLIETRIVLKNTGMKSVNLSSDKIILNFNQQYLNSNIELRNLVVDCFISKPKQYQFTPDYKVIYVSKKQLRQEDLLAFAKDIAQQIGIC